MSGDRFVDGPLGPAYAAVRDSVRPVTEQLIGEGIDPMRAGFVAYRLVRLVLETTDSRCSFADFLTWESSADGE